jgi:hypothetical protein
MANLAVLRLDGGGATNDLRVSRYRLPALWLACFEPVDLTVSGDAGDRRYVLATSPARALTLLDARRASLEGFFANVEEFLPAWTSFLRHLSDGRLHVDATEVLLMRAEADPSVPLKAALRAFDEPSIDGTVKLLEFASIGEHLDPVTRLVAASPPRRADEISPAFAGLPGADFVVPSEPASDALTGTPVTKRATPPASPAPPANPAGDESPASRRYALLCALVFGVFLFTVVRSGRPPTTLGWAALVWSGASGLLLWRRPRLGIPVYLVPVAIWAATLAVLLVTGHGGSSLLELGAALLMLGGWFQLRPELRSRR